MKPMGAGSNRRHQGRQSENQTGPHCQTSESSHYFSFVEIEAVQTQSPIEENRYAGIRLQNRMSSLP